MDMVGYPDFLNGLSEKKIGDEQMDGSTGGPEARYRMV